MNARTLTLIAGLALSALFAATAPATAEPTADLVADAASQTLELVPETTELAISLGGNAVAACSYSKTCLNPVAYCQCVARLGNEQACYTMTCSE